jgi:hypothetical protein
MNHGSSLLSENNQLLLLTLHLENRLRCSTHGWSMELAHNLVKAKMSKEGTNLETQLLQYLDLGGLEFKDKTFIINVLKLYI